MQNVGVFGYIVDDFSLAGGVLDLLVEADALASLRLGELRSSRFVLGRRCASASWDLDLFALPRAAQSHVCAAVLRVCANVLRTAVSMAMRIHW